MGQLLIKRYRFEIARQRFFGYDASNKAGLPWPKFVSLAATARDLRTWAAAA